MTQRNENANRITVDLIITLLICLTLFASISRVASCAENSAAKKYATDILTGKEQF